MRALSGTSSPVKLGVSKAEMVMRFHLRSSGAFLDSSRQTLAM